MKGLYSAAAVIIFICMVLFPLLSMRETVIPDMPEKINVGDIREPTDSFRLLDAETGSVTDIDTVVNYCGVVAPRQDLAAAPRLKGSGSRGIHLCLAAERRCGQRKSLMFQATLRPTRRIFQRIPSKNAGAMILSSITAAYIQL